MNKVSKLRAVSAKTAPEGPNAQALVTFEQDPINILIVDDEPKNLTVLEAVLDDPGYRLVRAETADQALLALVAEEFALLILDIRMPGMTGFELAQMIKERKKTAGVPIIFLTAYYNEDQHVLEGYGTGAVDYLHKPVNPSILRSKVAVFAELYRKSRECSLANRVLLVEVTQRRRAEEQLRDLNATLEQRVSERTQALTTASEALNRSEAKFRMLLDSAPDAMVVVDQHGVIVVTNAQTERLFGYPSAELLGQPVELLMPARARARHQGHRANFLLAPGMRGMGVALELLGLRKDGSEFPIEVSLSPMVFEQETLVSSAIRDISQRKRDEAQLIAALASAEKANQAKSEFLSQMSHELRTPLNALIGLTGLLIDSPLQRRQREYADKMNLAAQALRTLIDDILDFRRIEVGALRLEHAPLSLNAILHTTAEMLGVSLRSKPVEALFDVAPDVPDALVGDALRLQQILLNLTNNAAKFTQAGEIVVSVRCLASAEPTPSGPGTQVTLEFTVRDTGIGIARDQLDAIFNAFVQADSSTSRLSGGAGLGLSISARLAELMGGRIEVDSNPGQGSEFRLRVPMTAATREQATNTTAPLCAIPSAMRILIVDDHALSRGILHRTCASFGWQAKAVDSGAAALAELQRSAAHDDALEDDYDLLLLDWRMPGQDGLAMLRQAYATPGMGLPLVILMAPIFDLEAAVAASDDLNLDGIVAKPVTPTSLREAIKRTYAGELTAPLPHAAKTDRRLSGMRLLVAEDNELNQEVIEQILSRAGADVVIAADGLAALAALKAPGARFDAVLMDIQMPVMDGYSATRAIRAQLGMTELPIIAVTAYARPEDREKSRLAGMVGHLVKPINVEDLLDIVSTQRSAQPGAPATAAATHQAGKREGAATALAIELAGLDVETALLSFAADAAVYGALLRKFAVQHGQDDETARRLIGANDAPGAAQVMHKLGGIAGFLGAAEVVRLSAALEQALLEGDAGATAVLLEELQQAMQTVRASIEKFEAMQGAKDTF